ncbi:MAG: RNA polymerase sigma factor [Candidatus Marinimicrobia bacterium]|nr:RNA polymerase sigma factor [Candidatus Neomarinimicrobiota bacterium]
MSKKVVNLKNRDRYLNQEEFNRIILENYKMIYLLFLRMLRDYEEAKDLTQDTFLKAYKKINTFRGNSSISTWLYRIAINTGINHIKKRKRYVNNYEKEPTHEDNNDQISVTKYDRRILLKAISKLPKKQQSIVILRVFHNLPFKQIASIIDSTENAAKVNFSHAIKNLRNYLLRKNKL